MGNAIGLSRDRRMILRATLKPFAKTLLEQVEFKIDTGADLTTISRKSLMFLGYDEHWIKSNGELIADGTSTADGSKVESYVIKFPLFNLRGLDFKNWPMFVIFNSVCECGKVTHRDYRNLFGNDVIDMFDLTRFPKRNTFELEPSPPFVISRKVFDDQFVDAVTYSRQDAETA